MKSALVVSAFALGACADRALPDHLTIVVAPLSLPGIGVACYDLAVTSAHDTVWTHGDAAATRLGHPQSSPGRFATGEPELTPDDSTICSDRFGDGGGGAISYVGPCDASADADTDPDRPGVQNDVTLSIDGLYDAGGAEVGRWRDPCPGGCRLRADCEDNSDTRVDFDLTVMRAAEQGFFDVAVEFDDIFCSAKLDSCYANDTEGLGDDRHVELVFGDDGVRDWTAVFGLACAAGKDSDTVLHYGAVAVTCGGVAFAVDPTLEPGNHVATASSGKRLHYAVYRGDEQLACDGASCAKRYWNLAFDLDDLASLGGCLLTLSATASDGDHGFVNGLPTGLGVTYPYIDVAAPLVAECFEHQLDDGGPVATAYHGDVAGLPAPERLCATFDGGAVGNVCECVGGCCVDGAQLPDGEPCDDGDLCTWGDTCFGGTCTAWPVTCDAPDACQDAGACDPETGFCDAGPSHPDGEPCDDGDACTEDDVCSEGYCQPGAEKACLSPDDCHENGRCGDHTTGECRFDVVRDGTACSDGDGCTLGDTCQNGACAAGEPVLCGADACGAGDTCDPDNGACVPPAEPAPTCTARCTQGDPGLVLLQPGRSRSITTTDATLRLAGVGFGELDRVEAHLDGGAAIAADGTCTWALPELALAPGDHTIELVAVGGGASAGLTTTVVVEVRRNAALVFSPLEITSDAVLATASRSIAVRVTIGGETDPDSVALRGKTPDGRVLELGTMDPYGDDEWRGALGYPFDGERLAGAYEIYAVARPAGAGADEASLPTRFFAVEPLTEPQRADIRRIADDSQTRYAELRADHDAADALALLLAEETGDPALAGIGTSGGGTGLWYVFTSGVVLVASFELDGDTRDVGLPGGGGGVSVGDPVRIGNTTGLLMTPFATGNLGFAQNENDVIPGKIAAGHCDPAPYIDGPYSDASASRAFFRTLTYYGFVSIATHGVTYLERNSGELDTRGLEIVGDEPYVGENLDAIVYRPPRDIDPLTDADIQSDLRLGRAALTVAGDNFYVGAAGNVHGIDVALNSRWFLAIPGEFPQSIIYIGACHSFQSGDLAQAFIEKGAMAYYGFDGAVRSQFAFDKGSALFECLASPHKTASDCFLEPTTDAAATWSYDTGTRDPYLCAGTDDGGAPDYSCEGCGCPFGGGGTGCYRGCKSYCYANGCCGI